MGSDSENDNLPANGETVHMVCDADLNKMPCRSNTPARFAA